MRVISVVESTGARLFGLEESEVMERRRYVGHVRREIEVCLERWCVSLLLPLRPFVTMLIVSGFDVPLDDALGSGRRPPLKTDIYARTLRTSRIGRARVCAGTRRLAG